MVEAGVRFLLDLGFRGRFQARFVKGRRLERSWLLQEKGHLSR